MNNSEREFMKAVAGATLPNTRNIKRNIAKKRNSRGIWIGLAACLVAVATVCVTVEPVRATIVSWFSENASVQNYLATPEEERGATSEIDEIVKNSQPENASESTIEFVEMTEEWQTWADSLNPTIGQPYYDGYNLIVPFDFGGGAEELAAGDFIMSQDAQYPVHVHTGAITSATMDDQTYLVGGHASISQSLDEQLSEYIDEQTMRFTEEGQRMVADINSVPYTATVALTEQQDLQGMTEQEIESAVASGEGGSMKTIVTPGDHDISFKIPLVATDYRELIVEEDGTSYAGELIGFVELSFGFHAESMETQTQTIEASTTFSGETVFGWSDSSDPINGYFENRTVDMTGIVMSVSQMEIRPTETIMTLSFEFPENFEYPKEFFYSFLPEFEKDGLPFNEKYSTTDGFDMILGFEVLASEMESAKSITIIPTVAQYVSFDDFPLAEDGVTTIPHDEFTGWQEDRTELTHCALEYALE